MKDPTENSSATTLADDLHELAEKMDTTVAEFDREWRRARNRMVAICAALAGIGMYFIARDLDEKTRMEQVDCPQISQLIDRANLSETDNQRLCTNAYIRDCLSLRGVCSQ